MVPLPVMIVGAVVVAAAILQIVDRKGKGEPVEVSTLAKLTSFAGVLTGGVVFALQAEDVSEAMSAVSETAQEMFVGKPTF